MNNTNTNFNIKCKCGSMFNEDDFNRHFGRCEDFRKHFKNFDMQFGELLKTNSEPKENLLIIRALLKQYVGLLERKIIDHFGVGGYHVERNFDENAMQIDPDVRIPINNIPKENNNIVNENNQRGGGNKYENKNGYSNGINNGNKSNNPYGENFEVPKEPEQVYDCCQMCKDVNITYLDCMHMICIPCFQDYAKKDLPNMKCIECNVPISEDWKKMLLGDDFYQKIIEKFNDEVVGPTLTCPKCKERINFEKGAIDYKIRNDKNELLTKEAAEHYAHNRCRCPSCKIDFCAGTGCLVTPYHIGITCEEDKRLSKAKKCRYDDTEIKFNNKGPADDVCNNQECVATFKTACTKVLPCGHKCWGCKGEIKCPPCIDSECKNYVNLYDQDKDSYCNICFTEGLGNSPVVLLQCKHFIHQKCINTRLSKKWIGPKITFNHCLCPQCNNWVDCPTVPSVQEMITENKTLYEDICKKALERLKFEGLQKDPKLTDPNSRWYKNELAYSLNRLSYYMCYECKKPYFAGLRECGDGPNVNNNDPAREYNPKDLICGAHVNNFGVAGATECKTHGKEFIEYKCKFCCNIASWFCWGNTHFCEDCHSRQCKGDYVSKYTKDKLPKCDLSKCPVKMKHPENGEEFGLGCSVCRNNQDNLRNF